MTDIELFEINETKEVLEDMFFRLDSVNTGLQRKYLLQEDLLKILNELGTITRGLAIVISDKTHYEAVCDRIQELIHTIPGHDLNRENERIMTTNILQSSAHELSVLLMDSVLKYSKERIENTKEIDELVCAHAALNRVYMLCDTLLDKGSKSEFFTKDFETAMEKISQKLNRTKDAGGKFISVPQRELHYMAKVLQEHERKLRKQLGISIGQKETVPHLETETRKQLAQTVEKQNNPQEPDDGTSENDPDDPEEEEETESGVKKDENKTSKNTAFDTVKKPHEALQMSEDELKHHYFNNAKMIREHLSMTKKSKQTDKESEVLIMNATISIEEMELQIPKEYCTDEYCLCVLGIKKLYKQWMEQGRKFHGWQLQTLRQLYQMLDAYIEKIIREKLHLFEDLTYGPLLKEFEYEKKTATPIEKELAYVTLNTRF